MNRTHRCCTLVVARLDPGMSAGYPAQTISLWAVSSFLKKKSAQGKGKVHSSLGVIAFLQYAPKKSSA